MASNRSEKNMASVPLSTAKEGEDFSQNSTQILPFGKDGGDFGALYIHIPFCKQACHYCDFHFSTNTKKKSELVEMLCKEIGMRREELGGQELKTIYFGGGTPSLLTAGELQQIFDAIYSAFPVAKDPEITLEANPDDLTEEKLLVLKEAGINRLSIGVQSFFEEDLTMMNRAHNAVEALACLEVARKYFDNISLDLIYGIPGMSNSRWEENIQIALQLEIPHFSCYALTVEPNTALKKFIEKGVIKPVDDEVAKAHFEILIKILKEAGYVHYEFSNFGKPGYFSRNNTAYWMGLPYVGIGPSAHSFTGNRRTWNINNNSLYIKAMANNTRPFEEEELTQTDRYNEYVMTRLRTMWGVDIAEVEQRFGAGVKEYLLKEVQPYLDRELVTQEGNTLHITAEGKFLSDGIAADLFLVNLE